MTNGSAHSELRPIVPARVFVPGDEAYTAIDFRVADVDLSQYGFAQAIAIQNAWDEDAWNETLLRHDSVVGREQTKQSNQFFANTRMTRLLRVASRFAALESGLVAGSAEYLYHHEVWGTVLASAIGAGLPKLYRDINKN